MRNRAVMIRSIVGLICFGSLSGLSAATVIQTENAQPGTTGWILANPATNHEIEGYASSTSVNAGGQIQFYVNTKDPSFQIDVYRMGWYAGNGGRLMTTVTSVTGAIQPAAVLSDPATGMLECNWSLSYSLSVPSTWVSGIYLAKLTGSSSTKQSYIIFVVREDSRASVYLYLNSAITYEAYNNWGGASLYAFNSPSGQSEKASFNRPYALNIYHSPAMYGVGAGEFLTNVQAETVLCLRLGRQHGSLLGVERFGCHVRQRRGSSREPSSFQYPHGSVDRRSRLLLDVDYAVRHHLRDWERRKFRLFGAEALDWQMRF